MVRCGIVIDKVIEARNHEPSQRGNGIAIKGVLRNDSNVIGEIKGG